MKIILFTFILVFFHGCSSKQPTTPTKIIENNETTLTHEIDTDEFSDEYEDENKTNPMDPLSGYNKIMTTFNDNLFIYIVDPISKGYATVLPQPLRIGISNFIHNIQYPIRLGNNLLQAKFKNATEETGRFIINSTVGIGGLFDPASAYLHLEAHNEDFGQTLGFYGVGAGFHVVLPLLGPSNVRDIIGLVIDGYTSPLIYQSNLKSYKIPTTYLESAGIYGLQTINKNSLHLGAYETLKKDAIDLYPFFREFYEQKRLSDIEE